MQGWLLCLRNNIDDDVPSCFELYNDENCLDIVDFLKDCIVIVSGVFQKVGIILKNLKKVLIPKPLIFM